MSPKLVKKLADKKHRTETGLFLVEGEKSIIELLGSDFVIETIFGTPEFLERIEGFVSAYEKKHHPRLIEGVVTSEKDLTKMGTLQTNNAGLAVARQMRAVDAVTLAQAGEKGFLIALDDIRDPGNLGTIMRIADWYGVAHIVASETTTDVYNPKTIAATMGSFTRVWVTYVDLPTFLKQAKDRGTPVMGAVLDGKNIHEGGLPTHGVLLMGSESHGISDDCVAHVTQRITIPKYGGAESLNVSVATGILLDRLHS